MGIILSKVRIQNFRSIEYLALELGYSNLLIGQNNSGKTNFLKALNVAVSGTGSISEDDIFVAAGERLERSKTALIDIVLQPIDENQKICKEFSEFWIGSFTDAWITTSAEGNFVGIRTEIKYNPSRDGYGLSRRCIREWGNGIDDATIEIKTTPFSEDMRTYLRSFYMDADRDIVQDLRNRKSYFGRVTSNFELGQDAINEIEEQLSVVNTKIIESIPSLKQTEERIAGIGKTVGSKGSTVEIEPVARKITDLNKGMDITMRDGRAASFPISHHGYGTRSWISFLTLSAFVEIQSQTLKDEGDYDQFFLLTMEEPEAHLHPQAQRQLFEQISSFKGQKVVSTHSPNIVAQCALTDMIYFSKIDGKTTAIRYKSGADQSNEDAIFREVINTRGYLLFASAVILCEGITEELALPVFFTEYFNCTPYSLGVSIISTGGQKYKQFLSLIKDFNLSWFIFSDGEQQAIDAVRSAVKTVLGQDINNLSNVVILENGDDYEDYLIHEGYSDLIIEAICEHEEDEDFFNTYIAQKNGQKRKGGKVRNYTNEAGRTNALIDLCHGGKTEYALPVAQKIIQDATPEKRIPSKIRELFLVLEKKIGIIEALDVEDS